MTSLITFPQPYVFDESHHEKMRVFVTLVERPCQDTQERSTLLHHKLKALQYHQELINRGIAHYAFSHISKNEVYILYLVDTLQELDFYMKRDPYFAYTRAVVTPVVMTEDLIKEAQDYLKIDYFNAEQIEQKEWNPGIQAIDADATYWMAWKEVPPFSPLLSEEQQNDVHLRTLEAQEGHFNNIEFADDNPVGMQVGVALIKGTKDEFQAIIEECPVFPDTTVEYNALLTLKQSWDKTVTTLCELRRPVGDKLKAWPYL